MSIDGFQHLLDGKPPKPSPQAKTAIEGVILDVGQATATFTVPSFHTNVVFGPAPFTRSSTPPVPGDKCLIVFVGTGIDVAWIVGWSDGD